MASRECLISSHGTGMKINCTKGGEVEKNFVVGPCKKPEKGDSPIAEHTNAPTITPQSHFRLSVSGLSSVSSSKLSYTSQRDTFNSAGTPFTQQTSQSQRRACPPLPNLLSIYGLAEHFPWKNLSLSVSLSSLISLSLSLSLSLSCVSECVSHRNTPSIF